MAAMRSQVLAGYRQLLRVRNVAFQGDALALEKSQEAIRMGFEANRLVSDEKEIKEHLRGVTQAVEMLQFNVLQGKLNDRGNYSVDIRPEQADFHGGEEKIEISHMDEENTPLEPPPLVTSTSGCKSKAT
uniref:Complex 1 LYR protein domain-containing protein n=1 Tax=Florenciella parvula TaxID=236787 RepID=A0A7S2C810_9STRA|mmetsp:Transcript_2546/g.5612  ORF Transcript_2546/g.5612 Transcript_2546/m.5612 type:complete len:130 (+) Transcript_2546:124-513(+)